MAEHGMLERAERPNPGRTTSSGGFVGVPDRTNRPNPGLSPGTRGHLGMRDTNTMG